METSSGSSSSSSSPSGSGRRYGIHVAASNFLHAPLSALLQYSGVLQTRLPHHETTESLTGSDLPSPPALQDSPIDHHDLAASTGREEVSIRIIGAAEHDNAAEVQFSDSEASVDCVAAAAGDSEGGGVASESANNSTGVGNEGTVGGDGESGSGAGGSNRETYYQRYDIQPVARWIEQLIPFSLLLLVIFIRQHLQGFFVTIWITAVLFKSNDILRKQTALKGERRFTVLLGTVLLFLVHVAGIYWWCRHDDLIYPLVLLPPRAIPPFWHAIFIILVNDTMVRQAAMVLKCVLLMYYKNSRGRDYRRQGQMLTLVEYLLLLYRSLLPTPVWYRFFLNKEYGSLFSSLITGLYLTFKLTSVVEKVQLFFAALKALSRKEVHYGSYATSEQVNAAGDLCAICQEKMHAPILLRCKHIFCEDCVSEWFERERTCPLCRALVKPADIRSYSDGSTNLFFQIF